MLWSEWRIWNRQFQCSANGRSSNTCTAIFNIHFFMRSHTLIYLPRWHGPSSTGPLRLASTHYGEATLAIDPVLLGPVSALFGALIGGGASLLGAIYTQRSQDRIRRVASEIAKRETVYADFVMSASNLLLNAYTHDEIALSSDEQRLIGLINRMRLFAPTDVVDGAEAVLRAIVEILLKPSIELRQLAKEALSKSLDPDPLLAFSSICRADLDNVHRTVV